MAKPRRGRSGSRSSSGSSSRSASSGSGSSRSRSRSRSLSSSSSPSRSRSPPAAKRSSPGARRGRSPSPAAKKGSPSRKGLSPSPPPKKASPPRKSSPAPESVVLHVDHLSRNVNEAHLKEIFGNFGEVVNVELSMDRIVNLPRGYGYVEYKKRADAEKALLYMDGAQIDGNVVKLRFTLAPRQKAPSPAKPLPPPKRDAPQNDKGATSVEKDAQQRPREPSPRRKPPSPPRKRSPPNRRADSPIRRRPDPSPVRRGDRRPGSPIRRRSPSPPRRRGRGSPSPRRRSPIRVRLPRHRREGDDEDDASDVSSECSGEPGSPYGSPYPRWPVCKLAARMPPPPLLQRLGTAPRLAGGMRDRKGAGYSELQLMKERFSKLLLGEDMSGGGKGVSTAAAISNAITNLYATVFGSCHRLEPLPVEKKSMWRREMDCLLSVCDYIVEFFPSKEILPDGTAREVMATRPRSDIYVNLPALEKLDDMLLEILDGFQKTEFWYLNDKGHKDSCDDSAPCRPVSHRGEERWWLPVPCVTKLGLTESARRDLRQKHDCANQIHKAAMAINNGILAEIKIPESYTQTLPKCGRASVGDAIYRHMSFPGKFAPEYLLDCLEISSEHEALETADRVEAAMHVWRRKANHGHSRSPWSAVKDLMESDKNVMLASRAQDVLLCLKQRFPGLSQTTLDASKIQYNKDVGQAILESYSRVLESLAYTIVTCIDDVIFADESARKI